MQDNCGLSMREMPRLENVEYTGTGSSDLVGIKNGVREFGGGEPRILVKVKNEKTGAGLIKKR